MLVKLNLRILTCLKDEIQTQTEVSCLTNHTVCFIHCVLQVLKYLNGIYNPAADKSQTKLADMSGGCLGMVYAIKN